MYLIYMPRHAKRTQRRTKRRTRRARKTRRTRRIYGGFKNDFLQNSLDPNDYATYYISKYGKEKGNIEPIKVEPNSILVVVDMQNDFVDREITKEDGEKLNGPYGIGAFAVTGGKNCIEGINKWVDDNASNLSKIILTRDWHPPNHCSFGIHPAFPEHCKYNTLGADIVDEIKTKVSKDDKNKFKWNAVGDKKIDVDVVFKGFHSDSDSYGAAQYNDPGYLETRQVGSCCKNCISKTGGSVLNSNYVAKSLEQIVFETDHASPDKYTDAEEAKKLTDTVSKTYFTQYLWSSTVPDKTNIYVVGLAGDFCVKDTAINLKKILLDKGVNVHVIQDLTRYAFVPGKAIPFSSLENVKKQDDPNKSLADYIFKQNETDKTYKPFPASELVNLTDADIDNYTNWHFYSDQKSLIKDYTDNDVKLVYLPDGDVSKVLALESTSA